MSKVPWRSSFNDEPESKNIILLQIDIAGHSKWVKRDEEESKPMVYNARKELAEYICSCLESLGFYRVYWAGDGGLFARLYNSFSDADGICNAGEIVFNTFESWKTKYSLEELQIRVTATCILDVLIGQDPSYWYSSQMNTFLKYEREIGFENAFIITNALRSRMSDNGICKINFFNGKNRNSVPLPNGDYVITWTHSKHTKHISESPGNFKEWLMKQNFGQLSAQIEANLPTGSVRIGDSIILNASISNDGYHKDRIELSQLSGWVDENSLVIEDRELWKTEYKQLEAQKVEGTKLAVVNFLGQLTDDPYVRIKWRTIEYKVAKAFHNILEKNVNTRDKYFLDAQKILTSEISLPNLFSNHSIIICKSKKHDLELVLCHRMKRERPGTYSSNCWSVSFEEQFNPVEDKGRNLKADSSIHSSIMRGVREEILSDSFSDPVQISLYAFQMEYRILNFGFLGIVFLPETTFDTLKETWPKSKDYLEHDAIASIPLKTDILWKCVESNSLPKEIISDSKDDKDFTDEDYYWHPTSKARLALAIWYFSSLLSKK